MAHEKCSAGSAREPKFYRCQPDATEMVNASIFPVSRRGATNWQT